MDRITREEVQWLLEQHPIDECRGDCTQSRALLELIAYMDTGITLEEIAFLHSESLAREALEIHADSTAAVDAIEAANAIASLQTENARLLAERDKAVEDLNLTANCDVCKHYDADEISCAKPTVDSYSCFEWRGTEGKA